MWISPPVLSLNFVMSKKNRFTFSDTGWFSILRNDSIMIENNDKQKLSLAMQSGTETMAPSINAKRGNRFFPSDLRKAESDR